MRPYLENTKHRTGLAERLLELITELSKVAGYKVSTQKSVMLPYASSESCEVEPKKAIPFASDQS
jgi:hypothetical protein